ncbi:MAG: MFS transporter [Gammaproteobacteria bacterium]|nr:MFS transporter [Gammaproteobacteria bacterium]
MSETVARPSMSPWTPLKNNRVFFFLWIATLVSNIGTWMHDVGAGYLATTLTDSAFIVALMQTASSLPAFFLLLPSGALADILDRRLYLLTANLGMAVAACLLGILTLTGIVTIWSLLLLTLCMGIGTAMVMPAWQSIIPEVVSRTDLSGAIALNTMGMNIARVLGALVAGVIIATLGPGAVFVTNSVTFTLIIIVLIRWKRKPLETQLPPEPLAPAVRTGLRYARHSPALRFSIYRSVGFYFFASVMWALFPLIARVLLGADEMQYGILFGFISVGAIINALFIPRLRACFNSDQLITGASLVFATGMIITALTQVYVIALFTLALCGSAWITVMTCAQTAAHTALPNWVRSRGIGVFLTFFMGSLALGPAVWGGLAQLTSIPTAMYTASIGLILASFYTRRWPTSGNEALDLSPSGHWKIPEPVITVEPQQGPVMICISYQVHDGNQTAFLQAMEKLGKSRRRDGAWEWNIMEDITAPGMFQEFFLVATWLDHLRQHERISKQDAMIQDEILSLLEEGSEPDITHFIKTTRE